MQRTAQGSILFKHFLDPKSNCGLHPLTLNATERNYWRAGIRKVDLKVVRGHLCIAILIGFFYPAGRVITSDTAQPQEVRAR